MSVQPTPRRSATRQATVARALNQQRTLAPHVFESTISDERITQPVMRCQAKEETWLAGIHLVPGMVFYLVSSKFQQRYYVLLGEGKAWMCSSRDARVTAQCIDRVHLYQQALLAKQPAA